MASGPGPCREAQSQAGQPPAVPESQALAHKNAADPALNHTQAEGPAALSAETSMYPPGYGNLYSSYYSSIYAGEMAPHPAAWARARARRPFAAVPLARARRRFASSVLPLCRRGYPPRA